MATKKADTKMDLFKKLDESRMRRQKLELALGRIRVDIMNLSFPVEHRETIDNVMNIVDNAMKSI